MCIWAVSFKIYDFTLFYVNLISFSEPTKQKNPEHLFYIENAHMSKTHLF